MKRKHFLNCEFDVCMSQNDIKQLVREFKEVMEKLRESKNKARKILLKYCITPLQLSHWPSCILTLTILHKTGHTPPKISDLVMTKQAQQMSNSPWLPCYRPWNTSGWPCLCQVLQTPNILRKPGHMSAKVRLNSGKVIRRHQYHLKISTDLADIGNQDSIRLLEIMEILLFLPIHHSHNNMHYHNYRPQN